MKKSLVFIFIYIFNFSFVFADTKLNLDISDTKISLEDYFELDISVSYDDDFDGGGVNISGLDSFYKTSQSSKSSLSNINGKVTNNQTLTIGFYPNETGIFEIGPATIGSGTGIIESNIVKIEVIDVEKEENITKKAENTEQNTSIDEKIGIKDIKNSFFDFKNINYLFLLAILFSTALYLFFKKIQKNEQKIEIIEEKEDFLPNFIIKLEKLAEKGQKMDKSLFYCKLNILFREYFNYIGISESFSKTFEELKNEDLKDDLLELFKKSYFNEFNTKEETEKLRENIILDFINLLK